MDVNAAPGFSHTNESFFTESPGSKTIKGEWFIGGIYTVPGESSGSQAVIGYGDPGDYVFCLSGTASVAAEFGECSFSGYLVSLPS
jgi:hypothetical protein